MIRRLAKVPASIYVTTTAWGGRLIAASVQLLGIPLLLQFLGPDQYAWLVVAISIQGWWLLTDLGLALSLQNAISSRRAHGLDDADLIVSAAIILIPVFSAFALLLWCFSDSLAHLLLPKSACQSGLGSMLMLITGGIGLLLACGNVAYRILYARHKGYWANILPAFGAILSLISLVVLNKINVEHRLMWAAVAWTVPTAIMTSGAFILLLLRAIGHALQEVRLKVCLRLLKQGSQFGLFSLLAAFTLQIDYIVIGKLMSDKNILLYNISTKMMLFISFFFTAVIQANWPVCSEAAVHQDWLKVDGLMLRILSVGVGMVVSGAIVMWFFRETALHYLAPNQNLVISMTFWGLLTINALMRVWSDTYAMLLQSMNRVKIFFVYVPIQSAICLAGQIVLGKYFGLNGVVCASIVSFLLTSVWILPREYCRIKSSGVAIHHEAA